MLSKLTFSLTSLVILLLVCFPVMAQVIPAEGFIVVSREADAAAAQTALGIDTISNHIQDADMPDLEEFFRFGGTVALIGNSAKIVTREAADGPPVVTEQSVTLAAKDLVISEIMWALDVDNHDPDGTATPNTRRQWIEIYNTMSDENGRPVATPTALTSPETALGLELMFIPYRHVEIADIAAGDGKIVLDAFSNLQFVRWTMPGENGNTTAPGANPLDPPLKSLHSAYRNLDYAKIQGIHKLNADNTVNTADNRVEQLKGVVDGYAPGSWKATPTLGRRNTDMINGADLIIGTPDAEHVKDLVFTGVTKSVLPAAPTVIINEVRNDNSPANVDWVELYNAGTEPVGLWDWELTLLKDDGGDLSKTDTVLVGWDKPDTNRAETSFPKNEDFKLQPGAYLLIVNRHPSLTSLANGVDIDAAIAGREVKAGATHQYIVRPKLDLPNAGISLVLRSAIDKNARHEHPRKEEVADARTSMDTASSDKIMDFVGNFQSEVKTNEYNTLVWPFKGWTKTSGADGKEPAGIPNNATGSLARKTGKYGNHKDSFEGGGNRGIGYDPGVDLKNSPGTPGYPNDSVRNALVDDKATAVTTDDVLYDGEISISEIMYDAGPRWHLIQWIELYNSSMTQTVNLKDWELQIRNATDDVESYVDSGFVFDEFNILPNQTVLIVSGTGTNDVAMNRVYNLYQRHRRELGLTNRRSVLLSPSGFYLKLTDKFDAMVDEAGNVAVKGATRSVMWELPARDPNMRQSLVRQYGSRELYDGTPDAADDGLMMESWRQSDIAGAGISFYGHRDDISTPGYRLGGPLPVSLSKFRPVRNQETGHVDITWITESELNNAGFNILRSEAKNGEFKVINVKGIIAGHGTTSEQHVYKFTDTNTKPNVVYYYQIEDVSINGLRTTLTTTHLRGHVGAAGKLTTTWGDLKLQK